MIFYSLRERLKIDFYTQYRIGFDTVIIQSSGPQVLNASQFAKLYNPVLCNKISRDIPLGISSYVHLIDWVQHILPELQTLPRIQIYSIKLNPIEFNTIAGFFCHNNCLFLLLIIYYIAYDTETNK